MIMRMKAIYRNGTFIPQSPCDFPQDSEVELTVESPSLVAAPISDPHEKRLRLAALVERMRANPIPRLAPAKFTRDELHERR